MERQIMAVKPPPIPYSARKTKLKWWITPLCLGIFAMWTQFLEYRLYILEKEMIEIGTNTQRRVRILEDELRNHRLRSDIHLAPDQNIDEIGRSLIKVKVK